MISAAGSCDRLASVIGKIHCSAFLCVFGFVIVWDCKGFFKARQAHFDATTPVICWPDVFYGARYKVLGVGLCVHFVCRLYRARG